MTLDSTTRVGGLGPGHGQVAFALTRSMLTLADHTGVYMHLTTTDQQSHQFATTLQLLKHRAVLTFVTSPQLCASQMAGLTITT